MKGIFSLVPGHLIFHAVERKLPALYPVGKPSYSSSEVWLVAVIRIGDIPVECIKTEDHIV